MDMSAATDCSTSPLSFMLYSSKRLVVSLIEVLLNFDGFVAIDLPSYHLFKYYIEPKGKNNIYFPYYHSQPYVSMGYLMSHYFQGKVYYLIIMIFNSHPSIADILQTAYSTGNCVFVGDSLYSAVSNTVKRTDLNKNRTSTLPFQNPHHNALLVMSPNQTLLVAIDYSGHATLFNLHGNFVVGEFNFKGAVKCAAFSNDGKLLAIGQNQGFTVYQCNGVYRTFEPLVLLKKYKSRHSARILTVQFSRDSRFLVTSGEDNIVFINNLFPINGYIPITLEAHRYKIIATYFSHDMAYLYTVDSGSNLFVWKWIEQTTQKYQNLRESKKRARNNVRGGNTINEEDLPEQQNLSDFERKVNSGRYIIAKKIAISQGGFLRRTVYKPQTGFLAGAYSNGKFSIWKLVGEQLEDVQTFAVGQHKISCLAVNDSCTWLALGIKSLGQMIVWEWKSQSYIINQRGFIHQTKQIAYNSVNLYATGTGQGSIRLWDSTTNFCIATLNEHQAAISGLKFSNSNTLFSSSLDGTVNAYDILKQKKFRVFHPDVRCQLVCLQTDPNGEVVFAGAFDPYDVYSWNVQTGHLLQVITGHEGPLSCLAFSNNNLITGSWDHTVKIHAIFSRKLNVENLQHGSQVTAIAVHPSKSQVAISTMKGQIFIWQPENAQLQGVLHSQMAGGRSYFSKISAQNDPSTKYLKAIAYSPCGNYLFGGGKSKYLYVYDINHRMLLTKIVLTNNKDINGVVDKLNSRYVKNGVATYELQLQQQNEVYSDEEKVEHLPGSTRIDVSELRTKLEVQVRKIVVKNARQLLVTTSFGTLVLNTVEQKAVFNPYNLSPSLTPQMIPQLIKNKDYTSALLIALKLNINARKLLTKIPAEHVKAIVSELQPLFAELLLEKICEEGKINLRQMIWVEHLLKQGYKSPANLRGGLECLEDQVNILMQAKGCLEMVEQLGVDVE